jgi:hypothetical protein
VHGLVVKVEPVPLVTHETVPVGVPLEAATVATQVMLAP